MLNVMLLLGFMVDFFLLEVGNRLLDNVYKLSLQIFLFTMFFNIRFRNSGNAVEMCIRFNSIMLLNRVTDWMCLGEGQQGLPAMGMQFRYTY